MRPGRTRYLPALPAAHHSLVPGSSGTRSPCRLPSAAEQHSSNLAVLHCASLSTSSSVTLIDGPGTAAGRKCRECAQNGWRAGPPGAWSCMEVQGCRALQLPPRWHGLAIHEGYSSGRLHSACKGKEPGHIMHTQRLRSPCCWCHLHAAAPQTLALNPTPSPCWLSVTGKRAMGGTGGCAAGVPGYSPPELSRRWAATTLWPGPAAAAPSGPSTRS